MNIPQVQPWLTSQESAALQEVIEANWITEGPKTAEFGRQLNQLIGCEYGVFAPNGTLALYLGLLALGIGAGDEVLVPDTTFIASANAVILTGATPIFVEVNDYNYQIAVADCQRVLSARTRAIMPVHLYGMAANMNEIMAFARQNHLLVIEDAAQAVGVFYQGQHAGTFGQVGCFSFFADKTITTGEGGYVVCQEKSTYENLLYLRNQGRLNRGSFIHPAIGYNFRITDFQAAVGLAQLGRLQTIIQNKLQILEWYRLDLEGVEEVRFLTLEAGSTYSPFRVVLICKDAHALMDYLSSQGVQPRTFFYPLHQQPCFTYLGSAAGGPLDLDDRHYSNAISGYQHGVCLPVFPTLTREQVQYISAHIKTFYAQA